MPLEREEEEGDGQARVLHLYIQGQRYKGHDLSSGPLAEDDSVVFKEFHLFMEQYFLTT